MYFTNKMYGIITEDKIISSRCFSEGTVVYFEKSTYRTSVQNSKIKVLGVLK